jgi:phosphoketolase
MSQPNVAPEFELLDRYWRAANYLSVGQIYLMGRGAPVTQQAGFDVLWFQRFAQQWIVHQVNLPDRLTICLSGRFT